MSSRLSAGVVVVRNVNGSWLFLMLRAYRNWDFPKGLVEAGEKPLEAAIREVREETLIDELQFTWGEVYRETLLRCTNIEGSRDTACEPDARATRT
jgi:8-oxo-dGTP pyrophosphatase MutT (NUDIX family)